MDAAVSDPVPSIAFPIKRGVWRELSVIAGCMVAGFAYLAIHFSPIGQNLPRFERLALFLALAAFVFPIALALIYLFRYKYKPAELGIRFGYFCLSCAIFLTYGAVSWTFAYQSSHWVSFFRENGILGWLFSALLGAALSEEFTRMLLQTRLGIAFHNRGVGFVAATFIWSCMHIPYYHFESPGVSLLRSALGTVALMPQGLLWGYLTHRTRSILPAVLLHAFNFWGLVNY
jgi:membrane protease YdiL (CAAX protease family)